MISFYTWNFYESNAISIIINLEFMQPELLHFKPIHIVLFQPRHNNIYSNCQLFLNFLFSHRIKFKKSNIRLRIFGKISQVQDNSQSFNDFWKFFRLKISKDH
jgi:hypothetical protein